MYLLLATEGATTTHARPMATRQASTRSLSGRQTRTGAKLTTTNSVRARWLSPTATTQLHFQELMMTLTLTTKWYVTVHVMSTNEAMDRMFIVYMSIYIHWGMEGGEGEGIWDIVCSPTVTS